MCHDKLGQTGMIQELGHRDLLPQFTSSSHIQGLQGSIDMHSSPIFKRYIMYMYIRMTM